MNQRSTTVEAGAHRLPLGGFQLDLLNGELLTREGELAGLRRQALEVLLLLGRRSGQVVSKDELMAAVWPRTVVGEGSLTQAVADIRKTLGDGEHVLVRNIARRGYMLVPGEALAPPLAPAAVSPPAALATTSADAGPRPARRGPPMAVAVAVAVAAAILLAATAWWFAREPASPWQAPAGGGRLPPAEVSALSVAVLPMTVEGAAGDIDWLAAALHGDLITELAQVPATTVIARDTMAAYAGKAVDPRQLARELGVRHVVRGSMRREGEKIRLNLVLVDGDTGVQRWGQTFLAEHATLPQTLGDFAAQLERALQMQIVLAGAARAGVLSPAQVSADELAMRGWALWYRGFNRENLSGALALFERAVQINPDSVRAWHGISIMNLHGLLNGWGIDRATAVRRIEEAGAQLGRIDRDSDASYNAKTIPLYMRGDRHAMLVHTQSWVDHRRTAIGFGAHGMALLINGRFDEAAQAEERALRISPLDPFRAEWQYRLAMAHFAAGRYELARDWGHTAVTTNPALRWPPVHAAALLRLGQADAAREAVAAHAARHPTVTAAQLKSRLPGDEPKLAESRDRLLAALRDAGMQ